MSLPKKHRFKGHKTKTKNIRKFVLAFSLSFLVMLIPFLLYLGTFIKPFPFKEVIILGEHPHLIKREIYDPIASQVREGFFGASVSEIQKTISGLPWVKDAIVRRVWPDKLILKVVEHKPLALWNDDGVITQDDQLIFPQQRVQQENLPHLYGPDDKVEQILGQWRQMGETLSKIDLKIEHLELAQRGAWQLTLSNGIQIRLGTQDIEARIQRFVRAYDKILVKQHEAIEYVDLRYTLGLAVGWKKNNTHHAS